MVKLHSGQSARPVFRGDSLAAHLADLALAERQNAPEPEYDLSLPYYHGTAQHFIGPPTPQQSPSWERDALFLSPHLENAGIFAAGASDRHMAEPQIWEARIADDNIYPMGGDRIRPTARDIADAAQMLRKLQASDPSLADRYGFVLPPHVGIDIDEEQILTMRDTTDPASVHWSDILILDPTDPYAPITYSAWADGGADDHNLVSLKRLRRQADQPGNEWLKRMLKQIRAETADGKWDNDVLPPNWTEQQGRLTADNDASARKALEIHMREADLNEERSTLNAAQRWSDQSGWVGHDLAPALASKWEERKAQIDGERSQLPDHFQNLRPEADITDLPYEPHQEGDMGEAKELVRDLPRKADEMVMMIKYAEQWDDDEESVEELVEMLEDLADAYWEAHDAVRELPYSGEKNELYQQLGEWIIYNAGNIPSMATLNQRLDAVRNQ